jgi:hypothetical protein
MLAKHLTENISINDFADRENNQVHHSALAKE